MGVVDPVLGTGPLGMSRAASAPQLRLELSQAQQMTDNYREQVVSLEEEVGRLREEGEAARELFRQRSEKLSRRVALMNARYEQLERRRALEVEGYKNDVKLLRQKLKAVEQQLYKVLVCVCACACVCVCV